MRILSKTNEDYSKRTREELIAICKDNSGKKKADIVKLLLLLSQNELDVTPYVNSISYI